MLKENLLQEVAAAARDGLVSESELTQAFRANRPADARHPGVAEVLYYIGGAIVFIGIAILAYQNWDSFNSLTRILVTLGSAIAAYIVGVLFMSDKRLQPVAQAFFLITGLLLPTGLAIAFHEANMNVGSHSVQTLIATITLAVFLASYMLFRQAIFTVFSVIFGSWFYFSVTSLLIGNSPQFPEYKFYEYRFLLLGLSYVLLGYSFLQKQLATLTGWLYSFGALIFLASALALGGWTPNQNTFWEIIFPGLALGIIFIGVYLKSRAFLTFGSVFVMIYILKITAEYFTNTLGWPVALVIAGLALIAIGYVTFYLNKKYITKATV